MSIQYRKEFLDTLAHLTTIDKQIVIDNSDGIPYASLRDEIKGLIYKLTGTKESFNYSADKVVFYNYNEFYNYFKVLKNPEINIFQSEEERKIVMSDSTSTFEYYLFDVEGVNKTRPKRINFTDSYIQFKLTSDDINEIVTMNSHINSHVKEDGCFIKVKVKNNVVSFAVSSVANKNYFEKKINGTALIEKEAEFQIRVNAFSVLPSKRNYDVLINSNDNVNYMKLNWFIAENEQKIVDLDILIGSVKV